MNDKIFIDSNIFLYAFTQKDKRKHDIAKEIISNPFCISIQVINEVSKNLLYKLALNNLDIISFVNDAYERYDVISIDRAVIIRAAEIRLKYNISYYDSLILAAAIANGCNIVYSEDLQHGQIIQDNLKIINPFV